MKQKIKYLTFLIKNGLLKSNQINTHLTNHEKKKLFQLATLKRGGIAVEIGSSVGASANFLACGLGEFGTLYCVDTWNIEYRKVDDKIVNIQFNDNGTVSEYYYDDELKKVVYKNPERTDLAECPAYTNFNLNTRSFANRIKKLRGLSTEMHKELNVPIDLLFIDAWHEYEAVLADFESWAPKLKSGGIIIMHDYSWAEGVKKVVEEKIKPIASKFENSPNMFWAWIK